MVGVVAGVVVGGCALSTPVALDATLGDTFMCGAAP